MKTPAMRHVNEFFSSHPSAARQEPNVPSVDKFTDDSHRKKERGWLMNALSAWLAVKELEESDALTAQKFKLRHYRLPRGKEHLRSQGGVELSMPWWAPSMAPRKKRLGYPSLSRAGPGPVSLQLRRGPTDKRSPF
jgi:hypothetical protein